MTENEKIELFDKWYDENYDEWAEGEEGIALREELEQAFKGGIAELEKENAELKEEIDKKQHLADVRLEQELETYQKLHIKSKEKLDTEIALDEVKDQLTKAKEIIRMVLNDVNDKNGCRLTMSIYIKAEQFLKESE